ncbi:protein kinase domain-containing protein [Dokdonella sp.]|uniref:protein kinase domain-containing protein n=1 Tax=Dokdonella sp. TaxID=2291710 RepID=UPI003C5173A3
MTTLDIPGYVIRREVGVGGMASVYLALQTSLDREVALKVMAPSLAADPTFSKRFLQEARMLASLAHPNIVQVYDVGVTQAQLNYFSMQYLSGGDFAQRVRMGLSEKDLVRVLEGIANALGYAHQRGYVHRDVAPGNILFDINDTPLLTDFGIARAFSQAARITSAGISIGTSHYMSPEQARGSDVDERSDLYGLGVLVWFGLTGKPPYEGADGFAVSYAHVFEPIPRLPETQAHWQGLIDKALAKDPAERYQNAEEFIAALNRIEPRSSAARTSAQDAPTRVMQREAVASALRADEAPTRIGVLPTMEESAGDKGDRPEGSAAQAPRTWLPWALAAVGLLLIGAVGYALMSSRSQEGMTTAASTSASGTESVRSGAAAEQARQSSANAVASASSDSREPENADADAGVLDSEFPIEELDLATLPTVKDPVVELNRLGKADLAAQRLTNPPRTNAFERFSLALKINAESSVAKQGIVDTAQAYLTLADASWATGNLAEFNGFIEKAIEVASSIPEGADSVAEASARRQKEIDTFLANAQKSAKAMDATAARSAFEKVIELDPANKTARDGLRSVDRIGKPGFVFSDPTGSGSGPELVIISSSLAFARRETTKGDFAAWWRAGGQSQFAGDGPSCRDRESIFRSSRKREWQDPGITQNDSHPVVCVSFGQARAYAAWVSEQTGKRYRLPTPAEWEQVARTAPAGSCTSANLADESYKRTYDSRTGSNCDDGYAATAPVGRFPAVGGVFDIDGNVREWVSACGKSAVLTDGCREHGIRGRGWLSSAEKDGMMDSDSYSEDVALNSLGFRLVREIDK